MKNPLLIVLFFSIFVLNNANGQVVIGMRGEPVITTEYSEVQGTPYLIDDWVSGFVILDGQKALAKLKLDVVSNTLLFQGKDGETLALKNNFKTFTLTAVSNDLSTSRPFVFINGLPTIDKQTPESFYQLIGDGKVKLLKYYRKIVDEQPGTSYTASTTRRFKLLQTYYFLKNNQMVEIKPTKKAFEKLFEDHAVQFETYLKANNVSFKSDMELENLFIWYNSLT